MAVNLSIKNVPDDVAERLRARAARNGRSLQRELLLVLEQVAASGHAAKSGAAQGERPGDALSFEDIAARARVLFPEGTPSSVATIRRMRDRRDRELERRAAATPPRRSR